MTNGEISEKVLKGFPTEVYEKIIKVLHILHVPITTIDYQTSSKLEL